MSGSAMIYNETLKNILIQNLKFQEERTMKTDKNKKKPAATDKKHHQHVPGYMKEEMEHAAGIVVDKPHKTK